MKKSTYLLASLLLGGSLSASAATDLRYQRNDEGGTSLLDISQWGYFWHLQDNSGTTRPDGVAGNAWAGVPGESDTSKDSVGSVFEALTTVGNTDYNLRMENLSSVSFTLDQAVYFNEVDVSGTSLTSWTIDFGTQGSITTARQIDFGQYATTFTFAADLSAEDIATVLAGGTASRILLEGKSNYGIWNLDDSGKTRNVSSAALDAAGLANAGFVDSVNDIAEGQYGFVYVANGDDHSLQLVAKGMIPEPTTATLSLLALAGLAARRRRK